MAFNAFSFLTSLILTLILIPLNALLLKLTTKIFKLENTSYGTAFKITLVLGILGMIMITTISFIPSLTIIIYIISSIISLILAVWLIKNNYNVEIGKTILILIVWGIMSVIINIILITVLTILIGMIGVIGLKIFFGG